MIKAHVNEMGIVMRFDSPADSLSSEAWESLLNELRAVLLSKHPSGVVPKAAE